MRCFSELIIRRGNIDIMCIRLCMVVAKMELHVTLVLHFWILLNALPFEVWYDKLLQAAC
jgi:hypothetical protein